MKHLLKAPLLVCTIALSLCALFLSTTPAQAASSFWKLSHGRFSLKAASPTTTFPGGYSFSSVAAVSTGNVWAVGNYVDKTFHAKKTLIEHWNGKRWSIIKSPNPGSFENSLSGVAMVTANDIWAVGDFSNNSTSDQTLIEHWNGKRWSIVTSPNPADSTSNILDGIVAISASNIWSVGNTSTQPLIEHWNGKRWSIVTSPRLSSVSSGLAAIAAGSPRDIWAVGNFSTTNTTAQTLTEHWNGKQWSIVKSPSSGSGVVSLSSVAVVSSNNVWAVGSTNTSSATLIEHWNGKLWSVVKSPNPQQINLLTGVTVVSGKDIWAVGQSLGEGQVLIAHWNGSSWSGATSPNSPGSINNVLNGIAVISPKDIWAVGAFQSSNLAEYPLTEHWNGKQWSIVPNP